MCIDLDPQGNLSSLLGWVEKRRRIGAVATTIAEALRNGDDNSLPVYESSKGLYYVPASSFLSDIEPDLHRQMQSKLVLASLLGNEFLDMDNLYLHAPALSEAVETRYVEDVFDYVLIDCAPALSELTYNALGAASGVVIPVQLGSLSVDGIGRMIDAYKQVHKKLNHDLRMRGLLIVMADERTNIARDTIDYLRETYEADVFQTRIRQTVKIGESQYQHEDIFTYAPDCTAAKDYGEFVDELLATQNEEDVA